MTAEVTSLSSSSCSHHPPPALLTCPPHLTFPRGIPANHDSTRNEAIVIARIIVCNHLPPHTLVPTQLSGLRHPSTCHPVSSPSLAETRHRPALVLSSSNSSNSNSNDPSLAPRQRPLSPSLKHKHRSTHPRSTRLPLRHLP